jgi:hypothetical protein
MIEEVSDEEYQVVLRTVLKNKKTQTESLEFHGLQLVPEATASGSPVTESPVPEAPVQEVATPATSAASGPQGVAAPETSTASGSSSGL